MSDPMPNPSGLLMAGIGPAFLALIPVTNYLTTPGSYIQKITESLITLIPGVTYDAKRAIPALAAWYVFVTFAATGAASAAGLASSRKEGLDNNHPRKHINTLSGLPLRLRSAHYNLMEMFPGWAVAATLTQVLAPGNQQLVNLLGMHVVAKTLVFYPSYLLDIAPLRSLAHFFATSAIINVCWQLAKGAM